MLPVSVYVSGTLLIYAEASTTYMLRLLPCCWKSDWLCNKAAGSLALAAVLLAKGGAEWRYCAFADFCGLFYYSETSDPGL